MSRFVLRPWPTLALLLSLPVLMGLGLWQLQRAGQKASLLAAHEQQQALPAVPLQALLEVREPAWRQVHLHGRFDPAHSLLLDNRSRDGQAGVELLQPFEDQASGLWVLLNRGWLPWPDRRSAPVFSTPDSPLDLEARVHVPQGPAFHLQVDASGDSWPRLITRIDPPQLWQELARKGYAHELRMDPGPAAYRGDWPVVNLTPETHRGYALQWFSLAVALLGLYLYQGFQPTVGHKP